MSRNARDASRDVGPEARGMSAELGQPDTGEPDDPRRVDKGRSTMTTAARVVYEIRDWGGTLVARHVRSHWPDGRKTFFWQRSDGSRGLGGVAVVDLPLYGSERLRPLKAGALIVVTEGEKAADALLALGIPAVGTVCGAAACPSDDVLATLDSFAVAVWPDADPQGRKHAAKLLDGLLRTRKGKAEGLLEVDPAALGLTAKGADADDWRPEDPLDDLFVALKPYAPPPVLESAAPTTTTQRIVIKGGKTVAGLLAALDHLAIGLRYDERSARVQFLDATADFSKWTNSDDMYRAELRERIADKFLYVTKDGQAPLALQQRSILRCHRRPTQQPAHRPLQGVARRPAGVGRGEAVGLMAQGMLPDRRHQPRAAALGVVLGVDGCGRADLHPG